MPVEWVTAPREPALELLEAGFRERAGAVLIGPAGVGKTSLARMAAERFGSRFGGVGWVTGTASTGAVPFAAFSHLIDVPETGKTAAILRAARESLGHGTLLVVDDAHLLDKLSAALVYQLAVSGTARLVVTVASGRPSPDEISALWADDLLTRIDLEPPGHDDARLAAQVQEYVAGLPAEARGVLEYLAVEDPLPTADLIALASRDAVEQAETLEAIVIGARGVRAGASALPRRGARFDGRARTASAAERAGGTARGAGFWRCRRPTAGGGAGA